MFKLFARSLALTLVLSAALGADAARADWSAKVSCEFKSIRKKHPLLFRGEGDLMIRTLPDGHLFPNGQSAEGELVFENLELFSKHGKKPGSTRPSFSLQVTKYSNDNDVTAIDFMPILDDSIVNSIALVLGGASPKISTLKTNIGNEYRAICKFK